LILRSDVQLQAFNTLRLPSVAECFAAPATLEEAREVVSHAIARRLPITVLGGGSNVVLLSRIPGIVIAPRIRGIEVARHDDGCVVTAGAGTTWHDLVRFCLGQGLAGLENLVLIPGLVGAAPIQNIGAYGLELKERFRSLTAVSCRDGSVVTLDAQQCAFGYRDSVFKRALHASYLISAVSLTLPLVSEPRIGYPDVRNELAAMGVAPSPIAVAEAVTRVRRRKLPDVRRVPNAGSFFKNPVLGRDEVERLRGLLGRIPTYEDPNGVKVAAARLIEAAGWKGRSSGRAGVWARQPLVLFNRGDARGTDMLRLARDIQADIADKYNVALELEPAVLGEDE
jgi:UDP-N-acetylmuramate dehydrogenase